MRKKLDGVAMPGARPMVIRPASITRLRGVRDAGHHGRAVARRRHGAGKVERPAQHALGHAGRHLLATGGDVSGIGGQRAHRSPDRAPRSRRASRPQPRRAAGDVCEPCRSAPAAPGPPRSGAAAARRMRSSSASGSATLSPRPLIAALLASTMSNARLFVSPTFQVMLAPCSMRRRQMRRKPWPSCPTRRRSIAASRTCTSSAPPTTFIDGKAGELRYRGYSIHDLAQHSTFEETAYLLLHGELPTASELARFTAELCRPRANCRQRSSTSSPP